MTAFPPRRPARWALLRHRSNAYGPRVVPWQTFRPGYPVPEGYRFVGLFATQSEAQRAAKEAAHD